MTTSLSKFFRFFKPGVDAREEERLFKLAEGERLLREAATTTAATVYDIATLRWRLSDAINQLARTMKLLTEALIVCAPDGTIEACNPAAERIYGYNSAEILSGNVSGLFAHPDGYPVDDPAQLWRILDDATDGMPLQKLRGRRKDGQFFWCEVNVSNLERYDHSMVIIMLVSDLTAKMEIDKQLQLATTRYRHLFNHYLNGIVVIDGEHILAANAAAAKLWGYTNCEITALESAALLGDPADMLRFLRCDAAPRQFVGKRKDGTTFEATASTTDILWSLDQNAALAIVSPNIRVDQALT